MEKVLEDACGKLSVVATDILGVAGRAMMQALIDGERDAELFADLADKSCGSPRCAGRGGDLADRHRARALSLT